MSDLDEILGLKKKKKAKTQPAHANWTATIVPPPDYKSQLDIHDGTLVIASEKEVPSWFHRVCVRLLLGWRWKKL